jgi:REP element-mobilizing transposase RayT
MPHSFSNLLVHVIFSTEQRRALIDQEVKPRLCAYMGGIIRDLGAFPAQVNAVADHAHLLAQLPAKIAVADFVRLVKANSSKWIHDAFPRRSAFAWQAG